MRLRRYLLLPAFALLWPAAAMGGPDILIHDGTIVATATDYEMDGTMWTAFTVREDSSAYVYRSTDHGLSWEYRSALSAWAQPMDRIELVVGEGDSAYNYLFYLRTDNDGDLWVARRDASSDSFWNLPVLVGPDTISDFTVCRDYTGANYWLYAVTINEQNPGSCRALSWHRSQTFGRDWVPLYSGPSTLRDLHLTAGAGSYLYFTARTGDTLVRSANSHYLDPAYWVSSNWTPLTDEILGPVTAPAFTTPESSATVWCVWSQNFQNSGDWDVKYSWTTDAGLNWSAPDYLASSSAADEGFPDVRSYTSLGNQYINASYIIDDNTFLRVHRRYASAVAPSQWSDTLRINVGSAGTGSGVRPRLCYTPGGPFTGAGCVFVGAGLDGCWWNAPYPSAVAQTPSPEMAAPNGIPTIIRGVVMGRQLTADGVRQEILDATGRKVLDLHPGANDVNRLSPGAYFVYPPDGSRRPGASRVLLIR